MALPDSTAPLPGRTPSIRRRKCVPAMLVLTVALALLLTACGAEDTTGNGDKTEIRYGKAQGPYTVLFEEAIIPILEEDGYTFDVTDFSDLIQNNHGLQEKAIDVNVEQHSAYADAYNEANDGDIAVIGRDATTHAFRKFFKGR